MSTTKGRARTASRWCISLLIAYVVGISLGDRFTHPNMTETQLLMRLPKALVWQASK